VAQPAFARGDESRFSIFGAVDVLFAVGVRNGVDPFVGEEVNDAAVGGGARIGRVIGAVAGVGAERDRYRRAADQA